MKNSEIHAGFDQREVRDFLTQQLADSFQQVNQIGIKSFSGDPLDWQIESARHARDLADAQLKQAQLRKAIITLIKKMGWQEFDVSEMTTRDSELWLSFIGTEEDYQKFAGIIENED